MHGTPADLQSLRPQDPKRLSGGKRNYHDFDEEGRGCDTRHTSNTRKRRGEGLL